MGKVSNVDFPGESAGIVPGPSQTSGTTLATIAYGQGIDVTAIQMLSAYNTIANGGVYVAPQLADGYIDAQGSEHLFSSPKPRRVVSPSVAADMTSMLEGVVRVGTGTDASLTPYTVAGKTGTALVPSAGGYIQNFFVSSFSGFVPAEDPAITAMVVVVGTHQYGAEASAPVFAMIARDALQTLGVPPHKPAPPVPGVPLATPYGGEGEAAGGPLPGLTGTPDVVTPGSASTTSTTLAPGAGATTTLPTTAGGVTSVPESSGPGAATTATTQVPATTVPGGTTVPAATTTTAGLTTTTAPPPAATTTAPPPAATTTAPPPAATTSTAATTAPTVPAATTTIATTTAPAATTTAPTTAPAATTTAPTTPTTAPAATTTAVTTVTTASAATTTVPPTGTGSPASLLPGR